MCSKLSTPLVLDNASHKECKMATEFLIFQNWHNNDPLWTHNFGENLHMHQLQNVLTIISKTPTNQPFASNVFRSLKNAVGWNKSSKNYSYLQGVAQVLTVFLEDPRNIVAKELRLVFITQFLRSPSKKVRTYISNI